ncbi:Small RNA 2'-O-methyltransferase [Linum grandiflorum]
MEAQGSVTVTARKTILTPKAIIHQKFGRQACYTVEEIVQESAQSECPGLSIPQKGPSLYRCRLELPEISVVSDTCKKKKDAEQSAAEMALSKLGITSTADDPTSLDLWDILVERIKFLFSDEFISSLHPLTGHLKGALCRDGDLCGSVPCSVFAVSDTKISTICKSMDPNVDLNPFLALPIIMNAAARIPSVVVSEKRYSIQRLRPYSPEILNSSTVQHPGPAASILVDAIYIPSSLEKNVRPVTLDLSPAGYYMDVIAQNLGVDDAGRVLLSRIVGRASSETRLYYAAPESHLLELSSDRVPVKDVHLEGSCNARASYFCGQVIHGDAIMASIGYTWRSTDLFYENLTMQMYHRILLSTFPSGTYKLSREAVLTAELPSQFTTKAYWKGSFPREVLCTFCRLHRLSEPVLSVISMPSAESGLSRLYKNVKLKETSTPPVGSLNEIPAATGDTDLADSGSTFRCEIKIYSKLQDLLMECSPSETYKKQSDSVHNASLKVLSWLSTYFNNVGMPLERLNSYAEDLAIKFYPERFYKQFVLYPYTEYSVRRNAEQKLLDEKPADGSCSLSEQGVTSLTVEGCDSGACPANGSLLCVSYSVFLAIEGEETKELLERKDEFEFEIGTGAVVSPLEAVVTQMSVGQSALFHTRLPPEYSILAAGNDSGRLLSLISSCRCYLQFSVTLLHVTEPSEERMEQALFSPPLSKQRVEFAVQHIRNSSAVSLVDFGCGSGSLLDSLLDYPISLETIVGVDISLKGLTRAAKILNSKLAAKTDLAVKTAILYEGSITVYDSRLHGVDIGTCLEVIEHMEEEEASQFGDVVLSHFRPRILIVSTPNYEYNPILQKSGNQEEDADEKSNIKFRNLDHKFEWTRQQFSEWACQLGDKHSYDVEFGGVGGTAGVEPGFASQIAVFKRKEGSGTETETNNNCSEETETETNNNCSEETYNVIWEWKSSVQE